MYNRATIISLSLSLCRLSLQIPSWLDHHRPDFYSSYYNQPDNLAASIFSAFRSISTIYRGIFRLRQNLISRSSPVINVFTDLVLIIIKQAPAVLGRQLWICNRSKFGLTSSDFRINQCSSEWLGISMVAGVKLLSKSIINYSSPVRYVANRSFIKRTMFCNV